MSHIVEIAMEIKDLTALEAACAGMGDVEFMKGQKTYKWFGTSVGDYPLPPGYTAADLGKCHHAIRVKGNKGAYEVGIAPRRDGRPGYVMLLDFWGGGMGLEKIIGPRGERLCNHYGAQVAVSRMRRKGFRVDVTEDAQGVRAVCRK